MSDIQLLSYPVSEVEPYIHWLYFFHAWGFPPRFATITSIHSCPSCRQGWISTFSDDEQSKAEEAMRLYDDACLILRQLEGKIEIRTLFRLCQTFSDGDDLLIEGVRFPLLRQQRVQRPGDPHLCLSDFVRPLSQGVPDTVGVFAATAGDTDLLLATDDPYRQLLLQTLADRLAEAAVEKMHLYVRRTAWGYAPDESLTIPQLHQEQYQGIRPAVGYPSLPDLSVNFLLDQLLHLQRIDIRLTEHGAMMPHASVSGLMLAHPAARYFGVGPVGDDQLADYARRRGISLEILKKFLDRV